MAFRIGDQVHNIASNKDGTIVRGPRRASANMSWVLYDGDEAPKQTVRLVLSKSDLTVRILPLDGGFQAGDQVIDLTAETNGLPDRTGEVIAIDGSGVKVRYTSGTERWKRHIKLTKVGV